MANKQSNRAAEAARHHAQANGLARRGEVMGALKHRFQAFRALPGERRYRQALAADLIPLRLQEAAPAVEEALVRLLLADDVDAQALSGLLISLIKAHPGFVLLAAGEGAPETAREFAAWPLLRHALAYCILCDPAIEQVLVRLRRSMLLERESGAWDSESLAAIALQAALCEYIWDESEQEKDALKGLSNALEAGGSGLAGALLVCAYRQADDAAAAVLSRDRAGLSRFAALVERRQVRERRAEQAIAGSLPALGLSEDAVSRLVRAQYEANPYPRWTHIQRKSPRGLAAIIQAICAELPPQSLPSRTHPRILVAGCGTGAHAIKVASRYAGSRVTALDLSRSALAFAARRAEELKIKNLRFLQGDILALEGWDERFDVIECSGVLHHLADPLAGWRVLLGCLADCGLMRIGLYSELARRHIVVMQRFAVAQETTADVDSLRRLRKAIAKRAEEGDRDAQIVLQQVDFYSASGVRDLLLHAQERRFTLPGLRQALDSLNLEFLGFEHPLPGTLRAFQARFPEPGSARALEAWEQFENERPELFRTMYQFWCRRKA